MYLVQLFSYQYPNFIYRALQKNQTRKGSTSQMGNKIKKVTSKPREGSQKEDKITKRKQEVGEVPSPDSWRKTYQRTMLI